jgi:hypothetical protein
MAEDRVAFKLGRCVHFTGLYGPGMVKHETCAVGVRYDAVRVDHDPMPYVNRGVTYKCSRSFPCLSGPSHNPGGATCEKRTLPTLEQVQAEIAESDRDVQRVLKARAAIVATKLTSGAIDCPNCDGRLVFSIAPVNGHIMAKCSTEGCAAWME